MIQVKANIQAKYAFSFVFLISYLISTCFFFQDDHRDEKHRRKSKDYGTTVDDHEVPSSRHRDVLMIWIYCKYVFVSIEIEI